MQKDFIVATPDTGVGGMTTVTVAAQENQGQARSTTISIGGGGMTRNVSITQDGVPSNRVDYWGNYHLHNNMERTLNPQVQFLLLDTSGNSYLLFELPTQVEPSFNTSVEIRDDFFEWVGSASITIEKMRIINNSGNNMNATIRLSNGGDSYLTEFVYSGTITKDVTGMPPITIEDQQTLVIEGDIQLYS